MTAVLRPLQAQIRGQLVVYRTDSEQEVQKQETLLLSDTLQLRLQLLPTTPFTAPTYNSDILPCSSEPTTDYRGRSAYHVYYYYYCYYHCCYRDRLCLQSQELREVSFQELLIFYKNTSFLQPRLRRIIVNTVISVLKILEPIAPCS
jgi:hypothetical protein